jgi:hypothetical protein
MSPMQKLAWDLYRSQPQFSSWMEVNSWEDLEPHKQVYFLEKAEERMRNLVGGESDEVIIKRFLYEELMGEKALDISKGETSSEFKRRLRDGQFKDGIVTCDTIRIVNVSVPYKHTVIELCDGGEMLVSMEAALPGPNDILTIKGLEIKLNFSMSAI